MDDRQRRPRPDGLDSPRGLVICRIADVLRVPVECLLDERQPYPCRTPEKPVIEVTREEELFLRALRRCVDSLDSESPLFFGLTSPYSLCFSSS